MRSSVISSFLILATLVQLFTESIQVDIAPVKFTLFLYAVQRID